MLILVILDANMDQRRFTYNKDVLWILNYLSEHGKITNLILSISGRRGVQMSTRDGDFLKALKGVKTDSLEFGSPKPEASGTHVLLSSPFSNSLLTPDF